LEQNNLMIEKADKDRTMVMIHRHIKTKERYLYRRESNNAIQQRSQGIILKNPTNNTQT